MFATEGTENTQGGEFGRKEARKTQKSENSDDGGENPDEGEYRMGGEAGSIPLETLVNPSGILICSGGKNGRQDLQDGHDSDGKRMRRENVCHVVRLPMGHGLSPSEIPIAVN